MAGGSPTLCSLCCQADDESTRAQGQLLWTPSPVLMPDDPVDPREGTGKRRRVAGECDGEVCRVLVARPRRPRR